MLFVPNYDFNWHTLYNLDNRWCFQRDEDARHRSPRQLGEDQYILPRDCAIWRSDLRDDGRYFVHLSAELQVRIDFNNLLPVRGRLPARRTFTFSGDGDKLMFSVTGMGRGSFSESERVVFSRSSRAGYLYEDEKGVVTELLFEVTV